MLRHCLHWGKNAWLILRRLIIICRQPLHESAVSGAICLTYWCVCRPKVASADELVTTGSGYVTQFPSLSLTRSGIFTNRNGGRSQDIFYGHFCFLPVVMRNTVGTATFYSETYVHARLPIPAAKDDSAIVWENACITTATVTTHTHTCARTTLYLSRHRRHPRLLEPPKSVMHTAFFFLFLGTPPTAACLAHVITL